MFLGSVVLVMSCSGVGSECSVAQHLRNSKCTADSHADIEWAVHRPCLLLGARAIFCSKAGSRSDAIQHLCYDMRNKRFDLDYHNRHVLGVPEVFKSGGKCI